MYSYHFIDKKDIPKDAYIIVSFDVSSDCTGWSALTHEDVLLGCGGISFSKKMTLSAKVLLLHDEAIKIMQLYQPTCVARELPFLRMNVDTLIVLSMCAGVIVLASQQFIECEPWGFDPNTCKHAVGINTAKDEEYKKAKKNKKTKEYIVKIINKMYNISLTDKEHDAADAIAVGKAALLELKKCLKI